MIEERVPLPGWGQIGRGFFAVGVIVASTTMIFDLRDSGSAWWNATRFTIAAAQLVGLALWLVAIFLRWRVERGEASGRR